MILINTNKLFYNRTEAGITAEAVISASLKAARAPDGKPLTIWLESHGATGWTFGSSRSKTSEYNWTVRFSKFIHAIERVTGATVNNIVLNGCFTANELVNPDGMTYLNSPARILSLLLPDKQILGFIGQNASAKVTNVFHRTADGVFTPATVSLEQASILFKNGHVLESYHDVPKAPPLYCTHKYTPNFIISACELGIAKEEKEAIFYLPCLARETIAAHKDIYISPEAYGSEQLEKVTATLAGAVIPPMVGEPAGWAAAGPR